MDYLLIGNERFQSEVLFPFKTQKTMILSVLRRATGRIEVSKKDTFLLQSWESCKLSGDEKKHSFQIPERSFGEKALPSVYSKRTLPLTRSLTGPTEYVRGHKIYPGNKRVRRDAGFVHDELMELPEYEKSIGAKRGALHHVRNRRKEFYLNRNQSKPGTKEQSR